VQHLAIVVLLQYEPINVQLQAVLSQSGIWKRCKASGHATAEPTAPLAELLGWLPVDQDQRLVWELHGQVYGPSQVFLSSVDCPFCPEDFSTQKLQLVIIGGNEASIQ